MSERLLLQHLEFATRCGSCRDDRNGKAEFRAFLQAPLGLCRRTQPAGEADLAERREPAADRRSLGRGGDRQGNGEVPAGLVHPEKLHSKRPLAWITEQEVHYGWTAGSQGEPGAPSGHSARVSRTTYEILLHLGLIAETVDLELDEIGKKWLDEHGGGLG